MQHNNALRFDKFEFNTKMEMKNQKMEDVNKLILSINRNADQAFKESIRSYSASVFSSLLGHSGQQDPTLWKNKIMAKVEQSYDARSVLQCQEACTRFLSSGSVKKKSEILKMLYKLSESVANKSDNFDALFNSSAVSSNNKKQNPFNQNQTQATHNISTSSIPPQKPVFIAQQLRIIRYRGSLEQGISQGTILKQITYKLQNIKSEFILTDGNGFSALKPAVEVSDTVRRMVKQLSEIGWLYSKITDTAEQGGAVAKALRLAIREEMSEYYRWIAIIQNMIKQEQLTLRKLILWSYQPFQKLKWMTIVLEAAKPFYGCQIISIINSYRPQGSNSINQLLNRLLNHLLHPLFQYIYNWVYRGELTDSEGQFFIYMKNPIKNAALNSASRSPIAEWDEWQNKFGLQEKYIPNLIDYQSAVQIFKAGKTIYFLKNHCKIDYQLDVPFFDVKSALDDKLYESTSILSPEFKAWLSEVSQKSNSYLVNVLFQQFNLQDHLSAIKMFFLTGKGDFIQSLMQSLKEELTRPKHQIHEINLDGFVTEALKQSFPKVSQPQTSLMLMKQGILPHKKNIKEEIIQRLFAKKVENGSDGWDIFNFDYSVDDPISTVISPNAIRSYQKIFHFLWKVKRIEQSLKELWISAAKDYPHGTALPVLHKCHLLRQAMSHFVNNLYGYLMISIQSAWGNFHTKIGQAASFDEVLEHQQKLIEEILEITLNTPKSKHASTCLSTIFTVILKFTNTQQKLSMAYSDYHERYREYVNRQNLINKGLQFEDEGYELEPPFFNAAGLLAQVQETYDLYNKSFDRFYEHIKKQQESRISALCFRLDFNGFYSQREFLA